MKDRKQSSTSHPILFLMVLSSDHETGATGLSPAVTLSKDGGSFAAASGAVTEVGNGWYALAGNATDRGTLGELAIHATAAGADPSDDKYTIVPWDPFDGNLSLTGLSGLTAPTAGAIPTVGNGSGQINPDGSGNVTVAMGESLPGSPTPNSLGAALVQANGSAQASSALSTGNWSNALASALNTLAAHDPGGTLASASSQASILNAVNAITTNTSRTGITVPQFVALPATGSTTVLIKVKLFNLQGQLEDADSNTVTIHAQLSNGTSEDGNLSSTTMTRDSAGEYHATYSVASNAPEGGVYLAVTYNVDSVGMAADAAFSVAQADTVTSIASILTQVNKLQFDGSSNVLANMEAASSPAVAAIQSGLPTALQVGTPMQAGNVTVGGYATGQDPWTIWKNATPSNSATAGTNEWSMLLISADIYPVTNTDPYQLAFMARGSGAPGVGVLLVEKGLYDTGGNPLASTSTVVGGMH